MSSLRWADECDDSSKTAKWCDPGASMDGRAAALVQALTTPEKAGLLSNTAKAVPRLDLPEYDWWNEAVCASPGESPCWRTYRWKAVTWH